MLKKCEIRKEATLLKFVVTTTVGYEKKNSGKKKIIS